MSDNSDSAGRDSGINPCDIKWKLGASSRQFCVTIPRKFFCESAESLSQMRTDDAVQRFMMALVQFLIYAMYSNARTLGSTSGDSYLTVTDPSLMDRVKLSGNPLSTQPKYSIALEYLTANALGLSKYSPEDVTDINNIFTGSLFSGIRLWFLIFDDNFDPMEAFHETLKENSRHAILRYQKKRNKNAKIRDISSANPDVASIPQDSGAEQRNDSQNSEPRNQPRPRGRPLRTISLNEPILDPRTIYKSSKISNTSEYFRSITTCEDFGKLVDFLKNETQCSQHGDLLRSTNYPILARKDENMLHFLHWGTPRAQQWSTLIDLPDGTKASTVCEAQTFLKSYLRRSEDGTESWFEFPYPQLVFLYRPEDCSLEEMFSRRLPWMNLQRFANLYAEIKCSYLEETQQNQEKGSSRANVSLDRSDPREYFKNYSRDHLLRIQSFERKKAQCLSSNSTNTETVGYDPEILKIIKNDSMLLPPRQVGSSEDANDADHMEYEELVDAASFNAIAALASRNEKYSKMLDEIRIICPRRYPEALALLMEELLPSFSKVCHQNVRNNSKGVKALLDWFQTEIGIRISNGDGYDEYGTSVHFVRSLCHESKTLDPTLGPYIFGTAGKLLDLELVGQIADAHCTLISFIRHAFYCYVDPDVAFRSIGDKIKPLVYSLTGPHSGKSFVLNSMEKTLVKGTVTGLDSLTDKSMMTGGQGSNHLTDAVLVMDEASSVLTKDPMKMDPKTFESYTHMKSIVTNQYLSHQICHMNPDTKQRTTLRIQTPLSLCIFANANRVDRGTDTALSSRSIVYLSRADSRRKDEKDVSSMVGSARSAHDKHNYNLFALKTRIEQYAFCMICKMIQTHTIPVGVNIKVGTILYNHMSKILGNDYPVLKKNIRDVHKLYIMFYTLAILDAINICYFSEASPFKTVLPGGQFKYSPFSYDQLQQCMPALCLSEDSAIFAITEWLSILHNRVLYEVCLRTSEEWGKHKFPYIPPPHVSDLEVEAVLKQHDPSLYNTLWNDGLDEDDPIILKERKKRVEAMRNAIIDSTFFAYRTPIVGVKYAEEGTTDQELVKSINYRVRNVPLADKSWVRYIDTNWVELGGVSSLEDLIKNCVGLIKDTGISVDVISSVISDSTLRTYTATTTTAAPIFCDDGKTLAPDYIREKFYPKTSHYTFRPIDIYKPASGKTKIFVSTEYLKNGSYEAMLRRVLRCLSYKEADKRRVMIFLPVPQIPFLLKTYEIQPCPKLPLIISNPHYVDPSISSRVIGANSNNNSSGGNSTTIQNRTTGLFNNPLHLIGSDSASKTYVRHHGNDKRFTELCGNLEEVIFKEHFSACGKPEDFDYFFPKKIKELVLEYYTIFPNNSGKVSIYPTSFVYDMSESVDKVKATVHKIVSTAKTALGDVMEGSRPMNYVANNDDDDDDDDDDGEDSDNDHDDDDDDGDDDNDNHTIRTRHNDKLVSSENGEQGNDNHKLFAQKSKKKIQPKGVNPQLADVFSRFMKQSAKGSGFAPKKSNKNSPVTDNTEDSKVSNGDDSNSDDSDEEDQFYSHPKKPHQTDLGKRPRFDLAKLVPPKRNPLR